MRFQYIEEYLGCAFGAVCSGALRKNGMSYTVSIKSLLTMRNSCAVCTFVQKIVRIEPTTSEKMQKHCLCF